MLLKGIAATALAVAACAGTATRQSKPVMTGAAPGPDAAGMAAESAAEPQPMIHDPRLDEIRDRDNEIREFRREIGLRGDPSASDSEIWMVRPLSKALDVCPVHAYPQTPKCKDVCNLADHICENADAICDLAGELDGNSWAQGKCASAKASCKDGKKRCCDCNGDEPHEDGDAEDTEATDE